MEGRVLVVSKEERLSDLDFNSDVVSSQAATPRKAWRKPELKVLPIDETKNIALPGSDGSGATSGS